MKYIKIFVEGQTEEVFVDQILKPHLLEKELYPEVILMDGYVRYGELKKQIQTFLYQSYVIQVTTMIDFYGLPNSYPGFGTIPNGTCYERVEYLESQLSNDINHSKFLPYLALHEFEAMLFSSPERIADQFPNERPLDELNRIRRNFSFPEEINNDHPPAKRITALLPAYQKPLHGSLIASSISLETIRRECYHFDEWLTKLENLSTDS